MALRVSQALLAVSMVAVGLVLFLHIAQVQSNANRSLVNDQAAFLNYAKRSNETTFRFTGGRNRMPLYPWIQALFYSPELTNEESFERAKQVNIAISILVLAGLGLAFFAKFSRSYAVWSILCIAFLVYAIKSPFLLAENLYYGLFAFAFVLSIETLLEPKWYKTITCGALLAIAHFTKASALPALLIFASSYAILFVSSTVRRELTQNCARVLTRRALLPIVVFLVLLSPYLLESKAKYGSYFYNVNTTFYMWYDSWAQAKAGTMVAGDRVGYPDLPPEEIPSPQKYLKERGIGSIFWRLFNGTKRLLQLGCFGEDSRWHYGYCSQAGLGLIAIVFFLPVLLRSTPRRELLKNTHVAWYVAVLLAVYALGAAWYVPITGNNGVRIVLVLFVPTLWTVGLVMHTTFPLVADQSSREAGEFLFSNDGTYEPFLNLRNLHDGHCTRGD